MKRIFNRKRKRNTEMKTQQPQLPQDLIDKIRWKFPVKSLIRFKCVCKSWNSLISDPDYASFHFDFTAASASITHRIVLITNHTHEAQSIDFEPSLYDNTAIALLKLDFLLPQSYLEIKVGGSVRGFLFLYCPEVIYLWNPSTGVHKQIPSSPIVSNVDNKLDTYLYGFGYEPSTDDYLVVLGSYDPNSTDDVLTHFEFFSLRANIWKEIEDAHLPYSDKSYATCHHTCLDPKVGTLFNGAIHWLAHCDDTSMFVIVSFDLTERKISDMALPDSYQRIYDIGFSDLWVFRGYLSLWAMEDNEVHIWVIKEHGVSSSWLRIFGLCMDEEIGVNFYPICPTSYGNIVGFNGGTALVKYDHNGEVLEHRSYCNKVREHRDCCNHEFQAVFYTESLLSLPLPT